MKLYLFEYFVYISAVAGIGNFPDFCKKIVEIVKYF